MALGPHFTSRITTEQDVALDRARFRRLMTKGAALREALHIGLRVLDEEYAKATEETLRGNA